MRRPCQRKWLRIHKMENRISELSGVSAITRNTRGCRLKKNWLWPLSLAFLSLWPLVLPNLLKGELSDIKQCDLCPDLLNWCSFSHHHCTYYYWAFLWASLLPLVLDPPLQGIMHGEVPEGGSVFPDLNQHQDSLQKWVGMLGPPCDICSQEWLLSLHEEGHFQF